MQIMSRTDTIVRYVNNKWVLMNDSQDQVIEMFKTRAELIEYAHARELQKINRIKKLEQLYSRYQYTTLWGVY